MKAVAILKAITPLVAIVAIVVLDAIALMHGINGWLFATAMAAVAGLGGYELRGVFGPRPPTKPPSEERAPASPAAHKFFGPVLILALMPLLLGGCGVDGGYVAEDRATYQQITVDYVPFIDHGRRVVEGSTACEKCGERPTAPWFTEEKRELKKLLVESWDFRIRQAEGK